MADNSFQNILGMLQNILNPQQKPLVSPEAPVNPQYQSNLPQRPEWITGPIPTVPPPVRPQNQLLNALTPTPTAAPQSADQFKYQMGLKDYSGLVPQVQSMLKGTPLESSTNDFITAANNHGIDPRVLITIANNESSLGKNYPTDSYNPFGYLVDGGGVQGLKNAGFKSLSHAIDALTGRFQRQPTAGYQQFYKDPTIENLQSAYNATPNEQAGYNQKSRDFINKYSK